MQPSNDSFFDARLLVADDNPINQDIATRVLERMGCRIVTAENGVVAERLMAQEKFDLVLMDCEMPERDGWETTRRIREIERQAAEHAGPHRHTPVIALTAHAQEHMRRKCLAAGMDDLLVKPYNKAQMRETLRRWIGNLERTATPQEHIADAQPASTLAAVAAAPGNGAIDRKVLDDFLDSKGEAGITLLKRLLLRFAQTAPTTVAAIHEKHQAGLPEDLWRLAHNLRSSAAVLGFLPLSNRLTEVEKSARERGLEGLQPMLAALDGDLAAALQALQSLVGELG